MISSSYIRKETRGIIPPGLFVCVLFAPLFQKTVFNATQMISTCWSVRR